MKKRVGHDISCLEPFYYPCASIVYGFRIEEEEAALLAEIHPASFKLLQVRSVFSVQ